MHAEPRSLSAPCTAQVEQPFEEVLPYRAFSLTLTHAEIPRLPEILEQVPEQEWLAMRARLQCVWTRLVWLQNEVEYNVSQLGAERERLRSMDAFATLMLALRRRTGRLSAPLDVSALCDPDTATL